ncbi:MAG: protein kinase [Anaerolineales bacterium]|nr:protein kinase [Anaerolineales bacterium]
MTRFRLSFLLIATFLIVGLTACRGPSLSGGVDTSQGILMAIGGVILAILLMALFSAIIYAERRWQILRFLRLKSLLRQIPGMEKYFAQGMVLQRGARQVQGTGRLLKRYSRDFTGDTPNGKAGGQSTKSESWWGRFKAWWRRDKAAEEQAEDDPALANGMETNTRPGQTRAVPLQNGGSPQSRIVVPVAEAEAGAESNDAATSPAPYLPQMGRVPVPAEFTVDLLSEGQEQSELIGRRIDRYQVDSLLVDRPIDRIYQAYDLKMARPVALKVFRPSYIGTEARQESLLQDIRAAANLDHPSLVHIYDYGTAQGQLFLVSEFVNGSPINEYIDHLHEQKWHVALSHLLRIMAEATRAMAQAHRHGIVHGGLTMRRILVAPQDDLQQEEGMLPLQVKVGSIGLSTLYTELAETEPGQWPYLSPEQCRGEVVDARSDIYALGVILYRLTVKRLPFAAESLAEARVQHLNEMPVPPSKLRPSYPLKLEEIILRAMAKDPAERYQRASELAEALMALSETVHRKGEEAYILYAGEQVLHINVAGEAPRMARLDRSPLFVGAEADNDLILPGRGVNPYHMRLERDGEQWRVVDLGSETGTFLEDAHLIPELPELWLPGQTVVVGPYFLSWEEVLETRRDEVRTAVDGAQLVGISVLPMYLEVAPGEWGNLQISLVNQGLHVDHFHVEIGGLPPEWVQISNNNVHLLPGNQTYLLLTVNPPNNSTARAGLHECEVRVHPVAYPEAVASAKIEVYVQESAQLLTDLHPQELTNEGVANLTVENGGNLSLDYTVQGRNAADALLFEWPTADEKLSLVSGGTNVLPIRVKPKTRPWFGTSQQHPFEIAVSYPNGETHIERGQLQVNPRIPIWLLSLLGFLTILLCAALLYGVSYVDSQNQRAAAAAVANATAVPPTSTPGPTATAVAPSAPRTCADIFAQNSENVPGDYTLYVNGNVELPLAVYCAEGGGTYLNLLSNGGTANYATTIINGEERTVQYERVRIDPRSLTIDRTDRTFALVTGAFPTDAGALNDPDYGVAMGCSRTAVGMAEGRANINLTGTGLALADTVEFQLYGPYDAEVSQVDVSPDGLVVDLQVLGRCGWIWPTGDLQLVYLLDSAPAGE